MTLHSLQQMKRNGQKIVAVVVYDHPMAQIVDRAGVDLVSVGDSVGVSIWGQQSEADVTLDQILIACKAVRAGVTRALVSCDFPLAASRNGVEHAVSAARRLVGEGGADLVKVDTTAAGPDTVRAITAAGIAVWAQFERERSGVAAEQVDWCVTQARQLEAAGAALLDFRHSGPVAGGAVVAAVAVPVIGGLGGGPWLDGRVRSIVNAIGYSAQAMDDSTVRYANVARIALDAIGTYADDVRASRQILGEAQSPS